jgi:hypothetical protein
MVVAWSVDVMGDLIRGFRGERIELILEYMEVDCTASLEC